MYMGICQANDMFQISRSDLVSSFNGQQGMQSIKKEEEDCCDILKKRCIYDYHLLIYKTSRSDF